MFFHVRKHSGQGEGKTVSREIKTWIICYLIKVTLIQASVKATFLDFEEEVLLVSSPKPQRLIHLQKLLIVLGMSMQTAEVLSIGLVSIRKIVYFLPT